jgi:uncharacterized lipoprotein YmbA
MRLALILGAALALGACSPTVKQFVVAPVEPVARIPARVSSIEIRDLSLPRYATADEVTIRDDDGVLRADRSTGWADDPQRSLTLALARNLATITGARVAAEPWPFTDSPAASVTVQVEQLLAGPDAMLRFTGLYAVAPVASGLSDRSGRFNIAVPMAGNDPGDVAAAQGAAVARLAELIAQSLAR